MQPGRSETSADAASRVEQFGRVAIVHDYLSQFGGAERVALTLSDLFDAPIYTSFYEPTGTFEEFKQKDVRTSYLQKVVSARHFRAYAPFFGRALASLDLSEFDTVIVSSSGFAHHVKHDNAFIYCHTPPRFLYDTEHYFSKPLMAKALSPLLSKLRREDLRAAESHHTYAANSAKVAGLVADLYGKTAPVIHPPLTTSHLPADIVALPSTQRALMVTRLQPYKRVDLAMEACRLAQVPLTVVGSGISERELKASAPDNVTFLGRVSDAKLTELFATHSVVLTPGIEDFGFAPIEANYSGRPVVARAGGGALETVQPGITGDLLDTDDPVRWAEALTRVLYTDWDADKLRASTEDFQIEAFRGHLLDWIEGASNRNP